MRCSDDPPDIETTHEWGQWMWSVVVGIFEPVDFWCHTHDDWHSDMDDTCVTVGVYRAIAGRDRPEFRQCNPLLRDRPTLGATRKRR